MIAIPNGVVAAAFSAPSTGFIVRTAPNALRKSSNAIQSKESTHMEIKLTQDDLLAAELAALEIKVNQQPDLPPYVHGENCDICGRGIPRWEFVAINYATGRARCTCCEDPDDPDPRNCQVGRSHGGDIICRGCGAEVWAPTPQLRDCSNCGPRYGAPCMTTQSRSSSSSRPSCEDARLNLIDD